MNLSRRSYIYYSTLLPVQFEHNTICMFSSVSGRHHSFQDSTELQRCSDTLTHCNGRLRFFFACKLQLQQEETRDSTLWRPHGPVLVALCRVWTFTLSHAPECNALPVAYERRLEGELSVASKPGSSWDVIITWPQQKRAKRG